jgi:hypothetical protein
MNLESCFREVDHNVAKLAVYENHYLHRARSISWAFGIVVDEKVKGVLTISKAGFANGMCNCCGKERAHDVYELSRLWLDDCLPLNSESQFIGWCLRELRTLRPNLILVSYADSTMGHIGIVYQSTNWVYTGLTKGETDTLDGRKVTRSLKHRYVWFANNYCFTHKHGLLCRILNPMRDRLLLKWPVLPYPKADTPVEALCARLLALALGAA